MRHLADRTTSPSAVRVLLDGAVDYAGLFPPAALPMYDAVRNYAEYLDSRDAWALGRFVVPVARIEEFGGIAASFLERVDQPWRLSLLTGAGGADEWRTVEQARIGRVAADAIELRARTPADVLAAAAQLPKDVDVFYEIAIDDDPANLIAAIERVGAKAKVRTGGVTADAFPPARDLARFIVACARAGVPFKATAGLHHPVRATYRLTYAADSPLGEMFGFLNVLLGAAFARAGLDVDGVAELLEERDSTNFHFDADGAAWRGGHISISGLANVRGGLVLSFGSCSFIEPITELRQLGLL